MAIRWYGEKAKLELGGNSDKRMKAAVIFLVGEAKKSLSRSQPTKGKGKRRRGLNPSLPGEWPKMVTGTTRASVQWAKKDYVSGEKVYRFGSNYKVAKFLELGTKRMQRRPWLSLALSENMDKVRQIITRPATGTEG